MNWSTFWTLLLQILISGVVLIILAVGVLEVHREYSKKDPR